MWKKRAILSVIGIVVVALAFNLCTWILCRAEADPAFIEKDRLKFENPYARSTSLRWLKAGMHLHTNRTWFTPGRNSPEEIETAYSSNGYQILGFTDYERITKTEHPLLLQIDGYEWGMNLRKRHLSVFGSESPKYDLFPFYADRNNLQWVIDTLRRDNGFVVVNHPSLNEAFPLESLLQLKNYNAIEVFSPFGDVPKFWDKLLAMGIPSFCMASDDLHYLPREEYLRTRTSGIPNWRDLSSEIYQQDGESLMRYILVNADAKTEPEILRSLSEGNYLCIRKMARTLDDPKIRDLGKKKNGEIFYEFEDTPMTVDFVGPNSEILARTSFQKKGSYLMKPSDKYVRVQAVFPTAVLLSNPFFSLP
ncbi:phosphoesterase [Leptospira wolffii]|uniref:Phosphoesterase n=1 Tax=Leptospira wolffii TaxID=409998 RepID=A0A2M9Z9N4_9LEPT|nr:phosphoesterase [Leptospira wolffii]PJZ65139.1 phosphoesterase [Leptospira wolffii]